MVDTDDIKSRLDADEDELIESLDDIIAEINENLEELLLSDPTVMASLTEAVGDLDAERVRDENLDIFVSYYEVLWSTLGLAVDNFPNLQDEINTSARVNFNATDSDLGSHLIIDADEKSVGGDSGLLDDADVELIGPTEVIVGLTTGRIDGTEAFMQGRFEMEGDMQKGMEFGQIMDSIVSEIQP